MTLLSMRRQATDTMRTAAGVLLFRGVALLHGSYSTG